MHTHGFQYYVTIKLEWIKNTLQYIGKNIMFPNNATEGKIILFEILKK